MAFHLVQKENVKEKGGVVVVLKAFAHLMGPLRVANNQQEGH